MERSTLVPREQRRPLFVPIVTSAALLDCWSESISAHGLSLVGRLSPGAEMPTGRIDLAFELPDTTAIEVIGVVAWSKRTAHDGVALGVSLEDPPAATARTLARFVAEFRLRVVVVTSAPAERARLTAAVGDLVSLEFVEYERDVPPFDVAAVVLCGALPSGGKEPGIVDVAPRVISLANATERDTLEAFRSGLLAVSLPLDADPPAIRSAVFEVCRDWSVRSELRTTTLRLSRALRERTTPANTPASPEGLDGGLVADSPPMRAVLEQMTVVARRKVVVLFEGETGSGKEVLARALHARSNRAHRPLVVQDCGTLTDTLLDSELFGHVRGAFTGANAEHPGLFVVADGGTVFLDEIENTTAALQSKLLRVIETGQIRPVGGSRTKVVDVRVIAATNADLQAAVAAGRFRADLYYRLSAFPIMVPPLRVRGSDIEHLARTLATNAARAFELPAPTLAPAALDAIRSFAWPGNVRQLRNAIDRAVLLSGGGRIEPFHLPDEVRGTAVPPTTLKAKVAAFERAEIERALVSAGGVLSQAARALGANRITLARRMRGLGLSGDKVSTR